MRKTARRSALLLTAVLPACSLAGGAASPFSETARRNAFETGLAALENGEYDVGSERLAAIAAICPVDELGRRAMLLLAAGELDGRNPDGRPDAAAELAAFQLARSDGRWDGALAAELYTIALDFGADPIPPEDVPDANVVWDRYLRHAPQEAPLGADADSSAGADSTGADAADAATAEAEADVRRVTRAASAGPRCEVPPPTPGLVMPELEGTPLARRTGGGGREPAALPEDVRALQAEVQRLRGELSSKEQELDRIRRTLRP